MRNMIAYCGLDCEKTHILQQSMTIRRCVRKLQNGGPS